MADKLIKYSTLLSLGKWKLKLSLSSIIYQLNCLKLERLTIPSVGKNVEKMEL